MLALNSYGRLRLWLLALVLSLSGCSCDESSDGGANAGPNGGAGTGPAPAQCAEDRVTCDGAIAMVCDGEGGFKESIDCAERGETCVPSRTHARTGGVLTLGCVQCVPGETACGEDIGRICREDGSGFDVFDCDPAQGMTCEPDGCKGACAPPAVTTSYIGCDYYPTVTLNPVWSGFEFAVAVSNASDETADVIVTRGEETVRELAIGAGELEVVPLEWVAALKGGDQDACQIPPEPGDTRVVQDGAYRLRSNRPVTVYQFSALQYELGSADDVPPGCPIGTECPGGVVGECLSYSNDASLLLPATALTGDYMVASWPSRGNTASFFAVTATADNTQVTLEGRGVFRPGDGVDRDGQGSVTLNRGDVLEVLASHGDDSDDATGSVVKADKPVQVIGGHSCANIPDVDTGACDHLEEAVFPTQILGNDYVVSYPAAVASESPHVLRILAVKPDTRIEFDPPVVAPITLDPDSEPYELRIGSFTRGMPDDAELPLDVRVTGDKPILIAQYMQGQTSVPSGAGDPSMSLAVPIAQYRDDYTFTASTSYESNFVNVIARIGTDITLDGEPLDGDASDVGESDYQVIRARLPAGGSGVHRITADAPFGLVVYGYGRFTSYMYPGGLDLYRITLPGPD